MATPPKLTCTLPDGTVGSRRSFRFYTHCLVGWTAGEAEPWRSATGPRWAVLSWHGSFPLAAKAKDAVLASQAKYGSTYWQDLRVLPVNEGGD